MFNSRIIHSGLYHQAIYQYSQHIILVIIALRLKWVLLLDLWVLFTFRVCQLCIDMGREDFVVSIMVIAI